MRICVVGLGKIGLPLAVQYASRGHQVTGADISCRVVDLVNAAIEPFPGEAHLAEKLSYVVEGHRLNATTDTTAAVNAAEVVVVVVPLFVDTKDAPDFGWLDEATIAIGHGLIPGTLVAYETTLPVGTTRTRWKPMLENTSGLKEGEDFDLVFSPERVMSGRVFADLRRYPKLVGALTERGAKSALSFYESVLDFDDRADLARGNGVWDLRSAESAELAKLAETTYRDVNIGFANQLAKFADSTEIDIYKVIEACNSQPYSHIHQPGIAVGGHCIPVYPRLYLWNDPDATVVRAARETNASMPAYVVALAKQFYGSLRGARVLVLGAAYRAGVKETAYSGVFPLADSLLAEGALVSVGDPLYTPDEIGLLGFMPHKPGSAADVAILHTDHDQYRNLSESDLPGVRVIIDGRGHLNAASFPNTTFKSLGRLTSD